MDGETRCLSMRCCVCGAAIHSTHRKGCSIDAAFCPHGGPFQVVIAECTHSPRLIAMQWTKRWEDRVRILNGP